MFLVVNQVPWLASQTPLKRLLRTIRLNEEVFFGFKSKKVIPTGAILTNVQFSIVTLSSPVIEPKPVIRAFVKSLAWNVEFLNTKLCTGASCLVERPNIPLLLEFKPKNRQFSITILSTTCFWGASTSWYHIVRPKSLISQFFHEIVDTWKAWFLNLKKSEVVTFIFRFSKWKASIMASGQLILMLPISIYAGSSPSPGVCPMI